jgi:hypothetical protein
MLRDLSETALNLLQYILCRFLHFFILIRAKRKKVFVLNDFIK